MGITITTMTPAITLSFMINVVNIKINSTLKKSPVNAINRNFLKLPLLVVNTNFELRKYETMTETANAKIVSRTGAIMPARYM